jgi:hypothetical protein
MNDYLNTAHSRVNKFVSALRVTMPSADVISHLAGAFPLRLADLEEVIRESAARAEYAGECARHLRNMIGMACPVDPTMDKALADAEAFVAALSKNSEPSGPSTGDPSALAVRDPSELPGGKGYAVNGVLTDQQGLKLVAKALLDIADLASPRATSIQRSIHKIAVDTMNKIVIDGATEMARHSHVGQLQPVDGEERHRRRAVFGAAHQRGARARQALVLLARLEGPALQRARAARSRRRDAAARPAHGLPVEARREDGQRDVWASTTA